MKTTKTTKQITANQKKSKFALAWEDPNVKPIIIKINDMRAVLR